MKKKFPKLISKILLATAVLSIVAAVVFMFWWKGVLRPSWIEWNQKSLTFREFQVELDKRAVSVYREGTTAFDRVWKSKWEWSVQDALVFDVDCDGSDELILLVWKRGSYGDHMPFWETGNDVNLKQHIFIYTYDEEYDRVKPIWMSSEIAYDIKSFEEGAKNSLIVNKLSGESDAWIWDEWGLKYWCDLPTLNGFLVNEQNKEEQNKEAILVTENQKAEEEAMATPEPEPEEEEHRVSFVAVGDNLIHPGICSYGNKNNYEFDYFYENVKDIIEGADLSAINQETIFVKEPSEVSNYPAFGTIVNLGNAIYNTGFDIVSISNNHTLDKGMYGIDTTAEFYDSLPEGSITYTGIHPTWDETAEDPASGIKVVEKNGIKFALMSLTYDTNGIPSPKGYPYAVERFDNEERTLTQLKAAREMGDVVIVFAHWGTEYSKVVDSYQKKWTQTLLDNGVDVVVGSHPHVLQEYEMIEAEDGRKMLVYYSLGNFISGQFKEECLIGGIAEFTVVKDKEGSISIEDYTMEKVETKHSNGKYGVFLMETAE